MTAITYKDAGVDLELYEQSMSRLPRLMRRTHSPRVLDLEGGFAGLFELDFSSPLFARKYENPVLVGCKDGVGTKLNVAKMVGDHTTVGIDLVAMCVNDAICCGAEPLFFMDYLAMSQDDPNLVEQLVQGVSDGCVESDCALLGGETAIMPDLYREGDYDMSGTCVGVVERKRVIDGKAISPGDVVIGIASNGVHSNGFSLIRKIVFDAAGLSVEQPFPNSNHTIGDELLRPTQIYTKAMRKVQTHYQVKQVIHGVAHITGGGIQENIRRILPPGARIELEHGAWDIPPVFPWMQQLGNVADEEMYRVFNMGIGLAVVVAEFYASNIQKLIESSGLKTWTIGKVHEGEPAVTWA